jgi:alkyldihydroxyacetonephosphate synthase
LRAGDARLVVDALSGLVRLDGAVRLDEAERALGEQNLTLGFETTSSSDVNSWIAAGMPGLPDPFRDPVEQRLAGFEAVLASGARLHHPVAPRRATGPDLSALFVGANGRVGRVERAWLRAKPKGAANSRPLDWTGERDPAPSEAERQAFDAVVRAFG